MVTEVSPMAPKVVFEGLLKATENTNRQVAFSLSFVGRQKESITMLRDGQRPRGPKLMLANAAGPVMAIYLLAMRLPKDEFIGTSAWYFFILNWLKVPFSLSLGLITVESLSFDAVLLAGVVAGAFAGLYLAKKIPEKAFMIAVQVLTLISAVRMFI